MDGFPQYVLTAAHCFHVPAEIQTTRDLLEADLKKQNMWPLPDTFIDYNKDYFFRAADIIVVVGVHNLTNMNKSYSNEQIESSDKLCRVSEIKCHEKFVNADSDGVDTTTYDFAILTLESSLVFTPPLKIAPVCLPQFPVNKYENQIGIVSGWGKTDNSNSQVASPVLKDLKVTVLPTKYCQENNPFQSYLRYIDNEV